VLHLPGVALLKPSSKNWTTAITYLSILVLILILNMKMAAPYFLAITAGGILSLLSQPFYARLRNKGWKPKWAALLVTVCVTLLIVGPVVWFTYEAVDEAARVIEGINRGEGFSLQQITERLNHWDTVTRFLGGRESLERAVENAIGRGTKLVNTVVLTTAGNLPDTALKLALAVIALYFLLIDGRRLVLWLNDKIPLDWDVRLSLYASFKRTTVSVFLASIAAAAAQAFIMFLSYLVLRVPGAFLAGGATFIFAWIPILGSTPVWLFGAGYLYAKGRTTAMIIMLLLGGFTSVIDNYIRPMVLKGRSELHPLVSLVAIFGGIGMFGILGVLIGPVLAAVLLSLLEIWPTVGRRFGLTFEQEATIVPPTTEVSKS
jgi:predicted PurR-regulated permease PerM